MAPKLPADAPFNESCIRSVVPRCLLLMDRVVVIVVAVPVVDVVPAAPVVVDVVANSCSNILPFPFVQKSRMQNGTTYTMSALGALAQRSEGFPG